jgi:hypothetical protein
VWIASVYESLYRVRKRSRVVWQKQEDGAKHREKKARLIFATRVNLLGRAGPLPAESAQRFAACADIFDPFAF